METLLALLAFAAPSWADAPLAKIEVFPPDINLTSARDRQLVVVQATYADGITRNVTKDTTLTLANPALVRRDGNTFWPVADGETQMTVAFGGQTLSVPVKVAQATVTPPLSFRLDVMPVFMRAGCNTGNCHGAARGKDGFRISLFGFDPEGDHYRLTREMSGRRLNLAVPEDSTLLEKTTGAVQHTGGKRFEKGSELYNTIRDWIAAGAPNDDVSKLPKVVGVDLYPKAAVLDGAGATQQMTVRARYADGTDRDVTGLALFLTNNENSAKISPDGLVTGGERGEAFLMARFETYNVGAQILVLPKGLQFQYPSEPEANYVDTLVANKLKKLRIAPSDICSDEEFVRRAYIDLIGLMPSVEEHDNFLASTDPAKRSKLIDDLLKRKEFAEIWVGKWAEMLQIRTVPNQISHKAMFLYYNWLVEKLQNDTPMDQMVQEILERQRRHVQEPGDELLPDDQRPAPLVGERRGSLHGHAHPVRAVPQPPVRPLDAGRLLQLRRLLRADRPQAGRGLPRDDHLQLGQGRAGPLHRRPGHEAEVPRRRDARRGRQGPPRRAGEVAGLQGQSLVRHQLRQPRLGPFPGRGHRRAGGRCARVEPGLQSRAARRARQALHGLELQPQAACARYLQQPHVPARRSPTRRTSSTSGTSHTPGCGASRPRTCSTSSAR